MSEPEQMPAGEVPAELVLTDPNAVHTAAVVVDTAPSDQIQKLPNLIASLIRTYTPVIVGVVLAVLGKLKFNYEGDLTPIVTGVLTAVYYTIVRLFEHFGHSKAGILLGKATKPIYDATVVTVKKAA